MAWRLPRWRPGDKKTYIFEVTNTENGVTSEVGQDYSIIVETTGNLPLDFALTYDNSNPDHQGLFVNTGENGTLTFNGGMAAVRGKQAVWHAFPPAVHNQGTGAQFLKGNRIRPEMGKETAFPHSHHDFTG